ncbi:MAG TPA: hypothetical protein PLY87_02465, partial [Planctomycetaceae bacterium]|nr:hypothetical protein [Planctomycetaceae bacterium]
AHIKDRSRIHDGTPDILHTVKNDAVNPRSRAPALERNALEAPASSENLGRQEPPEQRIPRLELRNKDINSDRVKCNKASGAV